ncbi:MAG: ATP-binding protein [Promethearchaeota archaeon]
MFNEIKSFDTRPLIKIIEKGQDWILDRLFTYATKFNFVKYTSTLKEAWRISIEGLTEPLIEALKQTNKVPDFGPDEDFMKDSIASFGILEAQRHRDRGVTLGMFLGLIKYYKQSYIDLIIESGFERQYEDYCRLYIDRFFDRVELGFSTEWVSKPQEQLIQDLQDTNRRMTNEKNKYLTFFESLPNPAIFINLHNKIENINNSGSKIFGFSKVPGALYYSEIKDNTIPLWMKDELNKFITEDLEEFNYEKSIETNIGPRYFNIMMKKMLDVSSKFSGVIIILNDLTKRIEAEQKLKESEKRYRRAYDQANMFKDIIIHDINNILQIIQSSGELYSSCRNEPEDLKEIDNLLEMIKKAVERGVALVSNARKLSQLEDARMSIQSMEMFNILHESINTLKLNFKDQNINVKIQTYSDHITINANELLTDVFDNILVNAVKYSENTTIEIKIIISKEQEENESFIKMEFRDNGQGIPDFIKEAIFQKGSKHKSGKGLGFGLSLVMRILESYGGKIWVEDRVIGDHTQGSNFVLLLPEAM